MKRSSAELKSLARETLKGKYGTFIGTALILGLISSFASAIISVATFRILNPASLIIQLCLNFVLMFVLMIFEAGMIYQAMQACRGKMISVKDLFYGFTDRPMRYVILSLLISLIALVLLLPSIIIAAIATAIALGVGFSAILIVISIVLYIAAIVFLIIFAYGMSLCYYLLLDNPDMTTMQSIKTSWDLMKGNKGRFFYISLSFIGMSLLAILSCGIGMLWVTPYMNVTTAFFYLDVIGALDPPTSPEAVGAPAAPITPATPIVPVAPPVDPVAAAASHSTNVPVADTPVIQTPVAPATPVVATPIFSVADATPVEAAETTTAPVEAVEAATTPEIPVVPVITPTAPTVKESAPYVDDPVVHTEDTPVAEEATAEVKEDVAPDK